ncbi:hypothetical protein E2542_SST06578 [Spatholobus suberectus]|nr:hypothetical protein E2542_SST06578 [Spatholobus suberectus]
MVRIEKEELLTGTLCKKALGTLYPIFSCIRSVQDDNGPRRPRVHDVVAAALCVLAECVAKLTITASC